MNDDNINGWLEESKHAGQIIEYLSDALLLLRNKRVTLEEKAISAYFSRLTVSYALVIESVHSKFLLNRNQLPDDLLLKLKDVNSGLLTVIVDFLKMARYDANFLEQYVEHDFHSRLTAEHRFQEQLDGILLSIRSASQQS